MKIRCRIKISKKCPFLESSVPCNTNLLIVVKPKTKLCLQKCLFAAHVLQLRGKVPQPGCPVTQSLQCPNAFYLVFSSSYLKATAGAQVYSGPHPPKIYASALLYVNRVWRSVSHQTWQNFS